MATPPQDPTPRLRALDKLFSGRIRAEDRIIADTVKVMLQGSEELNTRVLRRINRLDLDSQGRVKQTDKNLREVEKINQLINLGTNQITNSAINDLQNDTVKLNDFYTKEIKAFEPSITTKKVANIVDSNQTRAVLNTNLDKMKSVSTALAEETRRQLTASLFQNIGPEEIAENIKELLVGKKDARGNPMTRHAETLARTAYNGYANALTLQNVDLDEVVAYYYSGPRDSRNRSFCSKRVEKAHDKETLENDIANQPGGTIHNPGGINCRHKLFPISMFDPEGEPFLTAEQRIIVFGVEEKSSKGQSIPRGAAMAKDRQENAPRSFKQTKIPIPKKQKAPRTTGGTPTNEDLKRELDLQITARKEAQNDLVEAEKNLEKQKRELAKVNAELAKIDQQAKEIEDLKAEISKVNAQNKKFDDKIKRIESKE